MKTFLQSTAILDIVVFAIAGVVCLNTTLSMGGALIWTGSATLLLGSFAAAGSSGVARGEYNLKFDQKLPQLDLNRDSERISEMDKSYSFGIYMAAASVIPILVGIVI